jgi:hypothetical protein
MQSHTAIYRAVNGMEEKMKKSLKFIVAAVAAAALLSGCGNKGGNDSKQNTTTQNTTTAGETKIDDPNVVATMDNVNITKDIFNYFMLMNKSSMTQSTAEDIKKATLDLTKEYEIMLAKANEAGLKLEEQEAKNADAEIDEYVKSLGEGEAGTKSYQDKFGITVEAGKVLNKNLILVQNYYQGELDKIKPTDEDLKKFYEEYKSMYEQVTVKHVLFMTVDQTTGEPLPQDKQDAAKKKS